MSWAFLLLFNLLTINRNVDLKYCDIKGNVKNPGVYLVEDGDVINDIIIKAGGLKKNSYVKNINLSKKVVDEMVINIITINEYEELTKECPVCECEKLTCEDKLNNEIITTTNVNNIETIKTTDGSHMENITTTNKSTKTDSIIPIETTIKVILTTDITTEKTNTTTTSELKININEASIDELMSLPGVGVATAKKIIEYRIKFPFLVIEDILNVSGIGEKLFAKIKDYITV